jgi:hypothetical protein
MDQCLRTEKLKLERKQFYFDFKENALGRFLRVTEDCKGRRDTIIIPADGLPEVRGIIERMIEFDSKTPPGSGSVAAGQRGERADREGEMGKADEPAQAPSAAVT